MIRSNIRNSSFIYCIEYRGEGRWILLNRAYKPLGVTSREWYDYDDPQYNFYSDEITKIVIDKLINVKTNGEKEEVHYFDDGIRFSFYLYDDGTSPAVSKENMDVYLKKLGIILNLNMYPVTEGVPNFVHTIKMKEEKLRNPTPKLTAADKKRLIKEAIATGNFDNLY